MSLRHCLYVIVLSALLAIALWYTPSPSLLDLAGEEVKSSGQYPTAYLKNIKTTQYNPEGHISHILTADKVSYFEPKNTHSSPLKNYALMKQPAIKFYNAQTQQKQPWQASSINGRSTNNGEELLLTGDVILIQKVSDQKFTTIMTEQLLIKPNQQYAETHKPVMIKNQSGTTTSIGLNIDLASGRTELLSKVKTRYDIH